MPREGAIIFRDLVGKLEVLRVECDKCGRKGQYRLDRLIEQYGIDAKLFDWEPEADCPRKQAKNLNDTCGAVSRFVKGGVSFMYPVWSKYRLVKISIVVIFGSLMVI
jgi:hypothetical protein